ncbi:MAG: phytanoyl-CoA dioxygenase family protein [Myxococcales bacterium]
MLAWLDPTPLLLPLTRAKSFQDPVLLGSPRLNRWGLHRLRVRLAYAVNRRRRKRLAHRLDPRDREAFDRDGFVMLPNFLPQAAFDALVAQVRALRVDVKERAEGSTLLRKVPVGRTVLSSAPALRRLFEDHRFTALMSYGEGTASAPAYYLQTVKQGHLQGRADPQCALHRDTFHPTVKAWLYLTDVPAEAGPLVYVPGSHHLNEARLAWEKQQSLSSIAGNKAGAFRIGAHELPGLHYGQPRTLAVSANTLVVADTFGFHARGTSSGPSTRMEVWAIGRRAPFLNAWVEAALSKLLRRGKATLWRVRAAGDAQDEASAM